MNIESAEKKLREADWFLTKMREQEVRASGDNEPFDFCLSAFLNAARTVDYRLRHEHGAAYKPWREQWINTNPKDDAFIKFFVDDRRDEVHESGSARDVKQESIPFRGQYSDPSGTWISDSVPLVLAEACGVPEAERHPVIYKPAYFFTIDGTERKATEACGAYLGLLKKMVAQFNADHP
jgi:hypothetical protein